MSLYYVKLLKYKYVLYDYLLTYIECTFVLEDATRCIVRHDDLSKCPVTVTVIRSLNQQVQPAFATVLYVWSILIQT